MSLKKQRNISMNQFSLTGHIKSLKRNELVDFESSLERDYIHILEFDENVRYYYEQPLKIEVIIKIITNRITNALTTIIILFLVLLLFLLFTVLLAGRCDDGLAA